MNYVNNDDIIWPKKETENRRVEKSQEEILQKTAPSPLLFNLSCPILWFNQLKAYLALDERLSVAGASARQLVLDSVPGSINSTSFMSGSSVAPYAALWSFDPGDFVWPTIFLLVSTVPIFDKDDKSAPEIILDPPFNYKWLS
ncbi:hypothetical protein C8J56DRAFT_1052650 [Mycena floridula]|nr:hypothetical protein C8J56DRAFT_1052650 [Mycena floridula]